MITGPSISSLIQPYVSTLPQQNQFITYGWFIVHAAHGCKFSIKLKQFLVWGNLNLSFLSFPQKQKKCKTISPSSPASEVQGHMTLVRSNVPTGLSYRLQKILSKNIKRFSGYLEKCACMS